MAKQVIGFEATLDGAKVEKSVKSIKTELREAQNEAINLARKFGDTSTEALQAAQRVAKLKDEVGDFKQRVDALNPDAKFRALGQSLQGVAGGFAGLQGAIGLFGTESKDLEKQLLKVQSALALSQGLDAILESKDAFANLKIVAVNAFNSIKTAIGSTGIGLLVVALGTIYAYWDDIKAAVTGVTEEQKKLTIQSEKNVKTEQDKLSELDSQDEVLKQQGLSERQILKLKEQQTQEIIKQQILQLEGAKMAAEKELELTTSRYAKTAAMVSSFAGTSIGLSVAGLLFNPAETQKKSSETINILDKNLKESRNKLAGYQNQIKQIDIAEAKEATSKKEKAIETERTNELERLKGIQAVSVGVNQETNNLIFASNVSAAKMNADVQKWNTQMEDEQSKARQKINEQEFVAKQENAKKYSALIGGFADLAGRQTGVGKTLAVAEATINTYLAASQVLSAKSPQYIVNPFLRFSSAALTIAMGLKNVKSILSVKVPNGGGAGGSLPSDGGAASAPTQAPIASAVQVSQTQSVGTSSVNIANQSAVKAFVVERDITDSQDRISKIKSAATF